MPSTMLFASLALLLAFTSVIADIEGDVDACFESANLEDLNLFSMSVTDKLGVFCPKIQGYFNCVKDIVQTTVGMSLEEVAKVWKELKLNIGTGPKIGNDLETMINMINVFEELCTEGTPLNNDYRAEEECLGTIEDPVCLCAVRAVDAYEAFKGFVENADEEDGDENTITDEDCMSTAFMTACIATIIHDTCGRRAFDTFNTIIKRTTIFKNALCSEEGLGNLKTSFLDSLEMEEEQKELFRAAFDLRKRRK